MPPAGIEKLEFTFNLRQCGSVQMKEASTSLTLFRPLILFRQIDSSSLDSGWHATQCFGGFRYRPHPRQHCIGTLLGIPSVISTLVRMQFAHMLAGFQTIGAPQVQHKMVDWVPGMRACAPALASAIVIMLLASGKCARAMVMTVRAKTRKPDGPQMMVANVATRRRSLHCLFLLIRRTLTFTCTLLVNVLTT